MRNNFIEVEVFYTFLNQKTENSIVTKKSSRYLGGSLMCSNQQKGRIN
jgi:hypothetical protein